MFYIAAPAITPLGLTAGSTRHSDFFDRNRENSLLSKGLARHEFLDRLLSRSIAFVEGQRAEIEQRLLKYQPGVDDPQQLYRSLAEMVDHAMAVFCYLLGYVTVFAPSKEAHDRKNHYTELGRLRRFIILHPTVAPACP